MGVCQGSKAGSADTAQLRQPVDFDEDSNEPKAESCALAGSTFGPPSQRQRGGPFQVFPDEQPCSPGFSVRTSRPHCKTSSFSRQDSGPNFAEPHQTFIVLDWDDTLFPTNYVCADLRLDWQYKLEWQTLANHDLNIIKSKLHECEEAAASFLTQACKCGHVVIVTLADFGWVDTACKNFFPMIGRLLRELKIATIYANERGAWANRKLDDPLHGVERERYYGLLKGRAMASEAAKFYSSYPGQSWKNILSVGDSPFERYGLLAAVNSYLTGQDIGSENVELMDPTHIGSSGSADGRVNKLRAKVCKFTSKPRVEDVRYQLDLATNWLTCMIELDCGFDLDLDVLLDDEDSSQVRVIEDVLSGKMPPTSLPKKEGPGSDRQVLAGS